MRPAMRMADTAVRPTARRDAAGTRVRMADRAVRPTARRPAPRAECHRYLEDLPLPAWDVPATPPHRCPSPPPPLHTPYASGSSHLGPCGVSSTTTPAAASRSRIRSLFAKSLARRASCAQREQRVEHRLVRRGACAASPPAGKHSAASSGYSRVARELAAQARTGAARGSGRRPARWATRASPSIPALYSSPDVVEERRRGLRAVQVVVQRLAEARHEARARSHRSARRRTVAQARHALRLRALAQVQPRRRGCSSCIVAARRELVFEDAQQLGDLTVALGRGVDQLVAEGQLACGSGSSRRTSAPRRSGGARAARARR